MARLNCLVVAWLFVVTAPASADIYKCPGKNGMDRYQNFPCSIDSIGSSPSGPPPANTKSPPLGASRTNSAAMPVPVAATDRSPTASEPRVGMTEDEVTAIWGEPEERIQDEPREGRVEIWRYGYGRSVRFSNKHRVLAVQL